MPEQLPTPKTRESGCLDIFLPLFCVCIALGLIVGVCSLLFSNNSPAYERCFNRQFSALEARGAGFIESSVTAKEQCEGKK